MHPGKSSGCTALEDGKDVGECSGEHAAGWGKAKESLETLPRQQGQAGSNAHVPNPGLCPRLQLSTWGRGTHRTQRARQCLGTPRLSGARAPSRASQTTAQQGGLLVQTAPEQGKSFASLGARAAKLSLAKLGLDQAITPAQRLPGLPWRSAVALWAST